MKVVASVFVAFGLLWLGAAAYFAENLMVVGDYAQARGVVVDLDGGTPVVSYVTARGDTATFWSSVSSDPPAYRIGEPVDVRYDPARPWKAEIPGAGRFLVVAFALFGLVFGGVGLGIGGAGVWRARRVRALQQSGRRVEGALVDIVHDTRISRNGRSPYRLVAQWQDPATDRVWSFKSDAVWYDPRPHVERGQAVGVWIDPSDPGRHYVDLSVLPPAGG